MSRASRRSTSLRPIRPAPAPVRPAPSAVKRRRGAQARRSGRAAEVVAALWLMATGWRIVGMRLKAHGVEIDILARRGAVLAVVEVKARATLAQALEAVGWTQRRRLRRAAEAMAQRPGLNGLAIRLDLIAMAPRRLPRHIADAWPQDGSDSFSGAS
jgi:putative endonuclease